LGVIFRDKEGTVLDGFGGSFLAISVVMAEAYALRKCYDGCVFGSSQCGFRGTLQGFGGLG